MNSPFYAQIWVYSLSISEKLEMSQPEYCTAKTFFCLPSGIAIVSHPNQEKNICIVFIFFTIRITLLVITSDINLGQICHKP